MSNVLSELACPARKFNIVNLGENRHDDASGQQSDLQIASEVWHFSFKDKMKTCVERAGGSDLFYNLPGQERLL